MIFIRLNKETFRKAFHDMGRGNQFSPEALDALFEYYEHAPSAWEYYELDVIEICCEWTEYHNPEEAERDYGDLDNQHTIEIAGGGVLINHG